jgi:predicted protein tyrosine phosphatase
MEKQMTNGSNSREETLIQQIAHLELHLNDMSEQVKALNEAYRKAREAVKVKKEELLKINLNAGVPGKTPWPELLEYHYTEHNYEFLQSSLRAHSPEGAITIAGIGRWGQYGIQLYLSDATADILHKVEAQLTEILPHINPNPETNDRLVSIIDPNLSQYGSYSLLEKGGKWTLQVTRGYGTNVVATFPSTHDMLKSCQNNFNMDRDVDQEDDDS